MFEESYGLLRITITDVIDKLIKYFVDGKHFTSEEENQLTTVTATSERLEILFIKISSLLKASNSKGFYMMLNIMREHGGQQTQTLADHITNRLKISPGQLSHICNDDLHGQNDKIKGLSVFCLCKCYIRTNTKYVS